MIWCSYMSSFSLRLSYTPKSNMEVPGYMAEIALIGSLPSEKTPEALLLSIFVATISAIKDL